MSQNETDRALRLDRQANARLFEVVDRLYPGFLTCHILAETPEQVVDLYTMLLDGARVLRFELPRTHNSEPQEVQIVDVDQFRQAIGQGKFRLMLDEAIQDYRHAYADAR